MTPRALRPLRTTRLGAHVLPNGQIHKVTGHHHGWLNLDGIQFAVRNQRGLRLYGWHASIRCP